MPKTPKEDKTQEDNEKRKPKTRRHSVRNLLAGAGLATAVGAGYAITASDNTPEDKASLETASEIEDTLEWKKKHTTFHYEKRRPSLSPKKKKVRFKESGGPLLGHPLPPIPIYEKKEEKDPIPLHPGFIEKETLPLNQIDPKTQGSRLEEYIEYSGSDPKLQLEAIKLYEGSWSSNDLDLIKTAEGQLLLVDKMFPSITYLKKNLDYALDDEVKKAIKDRIKELENKKE